MNTPKPFDLYAHHLPAHVEEANRRMTEGWPQRPSSTAAPKQTLAELEQAQALERWQREQKQGKERRRREAALLAGEGDFAGRYKLLEGPHAGQVVTLSSCEARALLLIGAVEPA